MRLKDVRVGILTISDKGSRGEREDTSGPEIRRMVETEGALIVSYQVIADEQYLIEERLVYLADFDEAELIFTTGGTGFSPRDVTPEATLAVVERLVPGFVEAIRHASLKITPHAMLSRAVSGIRGTTVIVNLPGSKKAVRESIEVILPALPHAIEVLRGNTQDCAGHAH